MHLVLSQGHRVAPAGKKGHLTDVKEVALVRGGDDESRLEINGLGQKELKWLCLA